MTGDKDVAPTPKPIVGVYEQPLWQSIQAHAMALQRCADCGIFQYPPAPVCASCLSDALEWTPISGKATIISWVIFHKTYLPAYPAPYNVIAVRLDEGPIFVSNLEGSQPQDSWIGSRVRVIYQPMPDGFVLPKFMLDGR